MSKKQKLLVEARAEILQGIRQQARSSANTEVCGILLGTLKEGLTRIDARIPGEGAAQGGAHVTFTHDTWEQIYRVKDKKYPGLAIVGWYHSHPGFGVFLSEHDLFIHMNFFTNPGQVAWVFDPHTDEEGCFVWAGGKVVRISNLSIKDERATPCGEESPVCEGISAENLLSESASPLRKPWFNWWPNHAAMIGIGLILGFVIGLISGIFLQERLSSCKPNPVRVMVVDPDTKDLAIHARSNAMHDHSVTIPETSLKVTNRVDAEHAISIGDKMNGSTNAMKHPSTSKKS